MKHKIIVGLSALLAVILTGCGENEQPVDKPCPECECPEVHTHTFASEWSHDVTNHWHSATCEHKEFNKDLAEHVDANHDNKCDVCGFAIPFTPAPHEHTFSNDWSYDVTNHWHAATCEHKEEIQGFAEHTYDLENVCTVCGYKRELKITKQPESTLVELGSPTSFEVLVNDPSLVKSYQWQLFNVDYPEPEEDAFKGEMPTESLGAESIVDIDCDSARTNKLVMPGPNWYGEKEYRCAITDIYDQVIYTERCHYTLKGYKQSDPFVAVGSRTVAAGQSLDLETTPFGTGKISLSEKGDVLTLDNVKYSNEVFDYDPFDGDIAIYFYCYSFQEDSFKVELIGDNVINNVYFEEDNRAGGISFGLFFSGRGKKPVVSVEGEGSLTVIGGSHSIYCNDAMEIHSDINLYSIANHWNAGIHAPGLTIGSDVRIKANLTSYLLESNDKANPINGQIKIEEDAVIDAIITPVQNAQGGSSLDALAIVTSSYGISLKNATLNIDVIFDYNNLDRGASLPPTTVVTSHNGGSIDINNGSDVNINISTVNEKLSYIEFLCNTIVSTAEYDVGQLNIFNGSSVTVTGDAPHCQSIAGPLADEIDIDSSKVYVDLTGGKVNCLASKGSLYINDSVIDVRGLSSEGTVYGVVAQAELEITNTQLHSVTNDGIALGTFFDSGDDEKEYDPSYEPQYLSVDTSSILVPGTASVNILSLDGVKKAYQYYETIYDVSDPDNPSVVSEVFIIG